MREVVVYWHKGISSLRGSQGDARTSPGVAEFQWRDVDMDAGPQLRQKFPDEVPVVFINGHEAFKYRIDRKQFLPESGERT